MIKKITIGSALFAIMALGGCSKASKSNSEETKKSITLNEVATNFVSTALEYGEFHDGYVDAYFGPDKLLPKKEATLDSLKKLEEIGADIQLLLKQINSIESEEANRKAYLSKQIKSLATNYEMFRGKELTFDQESKALYDAVAPNNSMDHYDSLLNELDKLVPGNGDLQTRYIAYKEKFRIPEDKLDQVLKTAIEEARKRTSKYIKLPENESFKVEYVKGVSWSAYNWFKGNSYSVIQINTSVPVYIESAVDWASHEGYPGHHVFNTLLESELVKKKGWMEYSIYPLYSPQSLLAEGSADFGIQVAFPDDERVAYERDVLFPLAGLDQAEAENYAKVYQLMERLNFARNDIGRKLVDGEINRAEAKELLAKYDFSPTEAEKERKISFVETYRSYVLNYNYGEDLVKDYVLKNAEDNSHSGIWAQFEKLLTEPKTASSF
ncbi:hypothetical protein [Aureibacter tunicatorum]|uniref:DUF885 domain-containing protein n=1 Tax=Aureibacter tunicatorum TaxID=866807 RepID=A0AAE4BQR6_9BACT|nr:hypothetical protein [Aureibacter tunicatorum]MDR6239454.1 hypothetical protein [Aureibacter tunicatorum]BDD04623.1 hypothetical protein AUTU_21060 [Aureibacter tunicatorum]